VNFDGDQTDMQLSNIDPWSITTPTFAWPYFSYEVSSAFRYRSVATNCPSIVPTGFHRGIDIPRKQQSPPINSAVNGWVIHVGPCSASSYGQVLAINTWHGYSPPILPLPDRIYMDKEDKELPGLEYLLTGVPKYVQVVHAHMDSIDVDVNDVVGRYQFVGNMGKTGTTAVHLHLETRLISHLWSSFVTNPSGSVYVNPLSRNQGFFSSGTLTQVANVMNSCSLPGEDFFGDPVYGTKPNNCTNSCVDSLNGSGYTNYGVNGTIEGVAGILKGDYFIPVGWLAQLNANELSGLGITLDDLSNAKVDASNEELVMIDQLTTKLTEHLKGVE
jgi:murein DD-endopeptidase MepM/ murein hydrolase activator NlpD